MLEQREGGCHCGRVRFRAQVDLELLSQCNCSVCTKKGILHLPTALENFKLLRGKSALTSYTFGTGVAQHTFCSHCGMHAFYVPRSQPDRITVNARCLDDVDRPSLKPNRFFDGRHWEEAQHRRIAEGGHAAAAGLNGAVTLKAILKIAHSSELYIAEGELWGDRRDSQKRFAGYRWFKSISLHGKVRCRTGPPARRSRYRTISSTPSGSRCEKGWRKANWALSRARP